MGKPTGFMDYKREDAAAFSVEERIKMYGLRCAVLSGRNEDRQRIFRLSA